MTRLVDEYERWYYPLLLIVGKALVTFTRVGKEVD